MTTPTTFTQESWAQDLLTRMGYPVSTQNMTSVLAWEYAEGGHFANGATYNPLNSTLGHTTYGSMNSAGVSTYPDYETGMRKTISTLNLPAYSKIRDDLAASADPSTTAAAVSTSPWGTWHGTSPDALLARARRYVAKHPLSPVSAAPTATAPSTAAPTALMASTTAAGFQGADVDGLDKLATDFTQAAGVCTEVKTVCEAIVAASFFLGPFGAGFIAYLKGTVIPWLTKIGEALTLMSKVLSLHSQAQKDASSPATSLASYATPSNLPTTNTGDYPSMSATPDTPSTASVAATSTSYLGGLFTIGRDKAGNIVDITAGGNSQYLQDEARYHFDRDAAGNVTAWNVRSDGRLGSSDSPILSTTGTVRSDPIRADNATIIGATTTYSGGEQVFGINTIRMTGGNTTAGLTDAGGTLTDLHQDNSFDLVLGPGTAQGVTMPGDVPAGSKPPAQPGTETENWYRPLEIGSSSTTSLGDTFGNGSGSSTIIRTPMAVVGGTNSDGLLNAGGEMKLGGELQANEFAGTVNWQHHVTQGILATGEAQLGVSVTGGGYLGTPTTNVLGQGGFGLGPGLGLGGYAIRHDGTYDVGGLGEVDEFGVGGRIHHDAGK